MDRLDLTKHEVSELDAFARQAPAPERRDGETFAVATTAPRDASDVLRLVAFSGRAV